MKIFDYTKKEFSDVKIPPQTAAESGEIFIMCKTHEVSLMRDLFGFEESTIRECTDLDESVRFTNYDGYDFVSMVHIELIENRFLPREINLYASPNYIVLVMPDHDSPKLAEMEERLVTLAKNSDQRNGRLNLIYFTIFHHILVDFSSTLEMLEDNIQALSDEIISNVNRRQFSRINTLKATTYALKKQLRAFSYLGEQMLLDENKVIGKGQIRYFRNINTRMKKLHDFSDNLYNFCNEILYTYDSRVTMKTNDTVNKLTAATLFFGPLTLITGIYGMNFEIMPELGWSFGYPLALLVMACVSLLTFYILKKNKWL